MRAYMSKSSTYRKVVFHVKKEAKKVQFKLTGDGKLMMVTNRGGGGGSVGGATPMPPSWFR